MHDTVACPRCARNLRVTDSLLGQQVKCPACATTFVAAAAEEQLPLAPRPPARRDQDRGRADEYDDDRPRRPRRYEEDEDYPRRYDDEDRPRQRRYYDEDLLRRNPHLAARSMRL